MEKDPSKQSKEKVEYCPLEPQPEREDIYYPQEKKISVHLGSSQKDQTYNKKVTWLGDSGARSKSTKVVCAAFGCNTRSGRDKVSFFTFPTNKTLRKTGSERLGRSDEKFKGRVYVPNMYSRLCSKHFEESAFEKSPSVLRSVGCGEVFRPQLKRDALPTILNVTLQNAPSTIESVLQDILIESYPNGKQVFAFASSSASHRRCSQHVAGNIDDMDKETANTCTSTMQRADKTNVSVSDSTDTDDNSCEYCFCSPCVTANEQSSIGKGSRPKPTNRISRKIRYKKFW
ncbi:uncharacterized protein LOC132744076 [Ruditapes philippinarum]|uniref:uncharacterized protein LOC132744076 n=1 Tax=Ruditapes philippinarum TaxID=129788 RepID=UPI00295B141D|nr:uncharacterized protein LOC132744076 [Ruditapes philippinarum]